MVTCFPLAWKAGRFGNLDLFVCPFSLTLAQLLPRGFCFSITKNIFLLVTPPVRPFSAEIRWWCRVYVRRKIQFLTLSELVDSVTFFDVLEEILFSVNKNFRTLRSLLLHQLRVEEDARLVNLFYIFLFDLFIRRFPFPCQREEKRCRRIVFL